MLNISITIKGGDTTIKKLRAIGVDVKDFSDELKTTGEYMVEYVQKNVFTTSGQVLGSVWQPLTPAYRRQKTRRYPGKPLLIASGKMWRSFAFSNTKNFLRVYNESDHFRYHQLGTRRMPRRSMLAINDAQKKRVVEIIASGLQDRIRRAIGNVR